MKIESHTLNDLHAYRYVPDGQDAKYALVISHGLGGHGGIYGPFCEHHGGKGVEIWSYDAPGHGRSNNSRPRGQWTMDEWAQATRDFAAHVKAKTGLPVFALGSSLGVGAAISAIDSPDISGVIAMGSIAVPGSPLIKSMTEHWRSEAVQQVLAQLGRAARLDIPMFFNFDVDYGFQGAADAKKLDPLNTWSYDLASWASIMNYDPPEPLSENTKPVLFTAGTDDPNIPDGALEMIVAEVGGPVTLKMFEDAGHQLMLFHTEEYSSCVHEFCLDNA
ncbi:alpha/beta hydrolase [Halioglobus maricola]|uniref:Alpha/beta hydrolase n=1 Tax=Halioglobus maricola TaxID=2601894 RepID=A0A5P9NHX4_9GAMM|nr:alpha/beta hydrolase [Halioglobus maricola]QFU75401.1 alpha/beta hydrolase [Halioglobus maricola]